MEFGRQSGVLTPAEKRQIVTLVEALTQEAGLGEALTILWEQQKAIGYILGTPCTGENLRDESQFLCTCIGRYWLAHNPARKDRGNIPILKQRGIIAAQPRFVYEGFERDVYTHYPVKKPGFERPCFLCSAAGANPNEVLLPVELGGAVFLYGANFATLGRGHFTFWTEVPILQKYRRQDSLTWLCGTATSCDAKSSRPSSTAWARATRCSTSTTRRCASHSRFSMPLLSASWAIQASVVLTGRCPRIGRSWAKAWTDPRPWAGSTP